MGGGRREECRGREEETFFIIREASEQLEVSIRKSHPSIRKDARCSSTPLTCWLRRFQISQKRRGGRGAGGRRRG